MGLDIHRIYRLCDELQPTRVRGHWFYEPGIVERFIADGKAVLEFRCGDCGSTKHTAKKCLVAKRRAARRLPNIRVGTQNKHYRPNRALKVCDDCGRRTTKSRCPRCVERRRLRPSRQATYRRARGDGYGGDLR